MAPIALETEDHSRDAAYNKALHGSSAGDRGGLMAMMKKDAKAKAVSVEEYFKHWDNQAAADETPETREVVLPTRSSLGASLTILLETQSPLRYSDPRILQLGLYRDLFIPFMTDR